MAQVVIASADDTLLEEVEGQLRRAGRPYSRAASWTQLLAAICQPELKLALVDSRLPELDPGLLSAIARSVEHRPKLRTVGPDLDGLKAAGNLPLLLTRLQTGRVERGDLGREIRLLGLGKDTTDTLAAAATGGLPVLIAAERGSGKKRLAERIHQLSGRPGEFLVAPKGQLTGPLTGPPGTVYVTAAELLTDAALEQLAQEAEDAGWGLVASSRRPRPRALLTWRHLPMLPLRERQPELRRLALLYLERHRRRMRLPRRRFDRALWALIRRHRWTRNAQELEAFIIQALAATEGPVIAAAALPPPVLSLVQPQADESMIIQAEGFEELVEQRLRPMVEQLDPSTGLGLYQLVVNTTERALIRLALSRTGGNQKAAARLLGVARNTLHTKAVRLGLRKD
ncbi:MAG: helix-turn-helix domain-containing protein [Myxococcota bacterium]|nr:helix-turn-helix domain-containing protein [Myxococcota bacterium]